MGGKIRASAYRDSDRQDSIHDKNYADEHREHAEEHRENYHRIDDFAGDRYLDPRAYAPRRKTRMPLSSDREDADDLNDRMPLFLEREVQQIEDEARLAELEADLREVIQQEAQASASYASQRYVSPDMYDEYEAPLVSRRSAIPSFVIRAGLMMVLAVAVVTVLLFLQGAFKESGQSVSAQLPGNVSGAFAAVPAVARAKEEKAPDPSFSKVASAVDNFQVNKNSASAYPPIPPSNAVLPERATSATDLPRVIDKAELSSLLARGNELIAVGDIAAARLLLQRAADAREPRAALALAGTYDPAVLRNLKVLGINPDLATARTWYEKAREYGSLDAQARLDRLSR